MIDRTCYWSLAVISPGPRLLSSVYLMLSSNIDLPHAAQPQPASSPHVSGGIGPSGCRGKREGFCSNAPHRGLCVLFCRHPKHMSCLPLSIFLGCATRSHFPCFGKRHFVDFPMSFCALGSRHAGLSSTSFLHTYTTTAGPLSGPCSCLCVCMYVQGISAPVRRQLASARVTTRTRTRTYT